LEASDGAAGLKVLQSDLWIDLLITDIGLPAMNGRQLVERARKTRPDMRALLITGYSDVAEVDTSAEAGVITLSKPFGVDVLLQSIRHLIASENSRE
jgi:DNA-binding NtrC family response regulator